MRDCGDCLNTIGLDESAPSIYRHERVERAIAWLDRFVCDLEALPVLEPYGK